MPAKPARLCRIALRRPRPRFGRLGLAVLGRRGGLELVQELHRRGGDSVNSAVERCLVRARGLGEAADLADVLERRGADLVLAGRWIEVVEGADVSAHRHSVSTSAARHGGVDSSAPFLAKRTKGALDGAPSAEHLAAWSRVGLIQRRWD